MKTQMPLSRPIRRFVKQTEALLDSELILRRDPEADPGGTLVDIYSYNIDKNVIIIPTHYLGLIKDFIIARQCMHLLIKGAAAKKSNYKVCSFTADSVLRGIRQIYIDALKDEAKKNKKLPVKNLAQMLIFLYSKFHDDINSLPWTPITNASVYYQVPEIRKTEIYYLIKEGKLGMDDMAESEEIIPQRYFVLNKSMHYARDQFLAKILLADELMPVLNIPQMKKFNHLEVKEMLTNRWTYTSWYQSKVVGDNIHHIMENYLEKIDWTAEPSLDHFYEIYLQGVNMTNHFISYMSMKDWFVWDTPKNMLEAQKRKKEYEIMALKMIFGEYVGQVLPDSLKGKL